jgi:hypothetical protein
LPASGRSSGQWTSAAREQRRQSSQKSETRISAIADLAEKGKREKKALLLFLSSASCGAGFPAE